MVSYALNKNTGMFSDVEGNTIGDRWIVTGEYYSECFKGFAFSQLFMASLTLPIKCLVQWNKALPTVLLAVDKKFTKLRACFGFVLSK